MFAVKRICWNTLTPLLALFTEYFMLMKTLSFSSLVCHGFETRTGSVWQLTRRIFHLVRGCERFDSIYNATEANRSCILRLCTSGSVTVKSQAVTPCQGTAEHWRLHPPRPCKRNVMNSNTAKSAHSPREITVMPWLVYLWVIRDSFCGEQLEEGSAVRRARGGATFNIYDSS